MSRKTGFIVYGIGLILYVISFFLPAATTGLPGYRAAWMTGILALGETLDRLHGVATAMPTSVYLTILYRAFGQSALPPIRLSSALQAAPSGAHSPQDCCSSPASIFMGRFRRQEVRAGHYLWIAAMLLVLCAPLTAPKRTSADNSSSPALCFAHRSAALDANLAMLSVPIQRRVPLALLALRLSGAPQ
jgi:hypothetical protein